MGLCQYQEQEIDDIASEQSRYRALPRTGFTCVDCCGAVVRVAYSLYMRQCTMGVREIREYEQNAR